MVGGATKGSGCSPFPAQPGHEIFQHSSYNPLQYAAVKDEPLRSEYPYGAYGYDLVNPYAHPAMSR